jgi:hypothetical protein
MPSDISEFSVVKEKEQLNGLNRSEWHTPPSLRATSPILGEELGIRAHLLSHVITMNYS